MPEEPVPRFLVAEPNVPVAELLRDVLDTGYPGCDVIVAERGDDAWRAVRNEHPDLAILEVDLPGKTGVWVLRQIQGTARKLPVIMTAHHATEDDEAELLRLGADDFLRKPFSMDVLLQRVRACLRRVPPKRRTHTRVGELTIYHAESSVCMNGWTVALTRKEHNFLAVLAERAGHVVPTSELMARVWNRDDPDFRVVYVAVNGLRRKVRAAGGEELIQNQKGVGYALVADRQDG